MEQTPEQQLRDALRAIIEGKVVQRTKHDLRYDGKDIQPLFLEQLEQSGYYPVTVEAVRVQPGERVPAFYLQHSVAYFGWIFWEQFTSWKMRKLWGSVIKNQRGDWNIQIPVTQRTIIYANELLKLEMDIDHPPEF